MICSASKLFGLCLVMVASSTATARADDHSYVGSNRCKKCHIKEYRSWQKTKMANVFDLLKPGARSEKKRGAGLDPEKDYTKDEECLRCHTVGYGKDGGYVSPDKTPNHLGVGCENCHGPGGTYLRDGYMTMDNKKYEREALVAAGLVAKVTAETCTKCHNEDSPFLEPGDTFDFEAKVKEGIHEIFPLKYQH
jgi:hypothetical protein